VISWRSTDPGDEFDHLWTDEYAPSALCGKVGPPITDKTSGLPCGPCHVEYAAHGGAASPAHGARRASSLQRVMGRRHHQESGRVSLGRGLVSAWIAGGDTSRPLPPGERPWVDGSKVAAPCPIRGCCTTLFDWSQDEVAERLAGHLRRMHGEVQ